VKVRKEESCKNGFPYIAYIPETVSSHPGLLLQLPGAGERGSGGDALEKVLIHGFPKIANDENLGDCILIMPQCPEESFWVAKIESLRSFVDKMILQFSADPTRIYLCGLSMGGFGTWYTAMAYPDLFAAIAPCCGGGMAWNAQTLKMPVWAFHGLLDTVVSPNHTLEMVAQLKETNPALQYDFYEDVGHDSWNRAFSEQTLKWLLSQKAEK